MGKREKKEGKVARASAPGKIIILGEHAVVYDKLGIATAIGKRSFVKVKGGEGERVTVFSRNFGLRNSLSFDELSELARRIDELKSARDFAAIKELAKDKLLPCFLVVVKVIEKLGFKPMDIEIDSQVPKNLGSSSSVFASIALATSTFLGNPLAKEEISAIAYEGDVVAHGGTPSGIDNSVVTFGGWISYRKSEGVKLLNINFHLPILIVDSGEPARTSETVSQIRELRESKPDFVNAILDSLHEISLAGLEAIKSKNLQKLGEALTRYYNELRKLGISTEKLDEIIKLALQSKALGAKPTGGWGGGCCIVLARDEKQANELKEVYKSVGFKSFLTQLGEEGVREEK